jgi:DNA-binding transcriptional MerR regulator
VEITSKALSIPVISLGQQERLELIQKLHKEGFSDADIAEYMNERNMKTPTSKKYYQELVWVTRNKFLKRNLRKKDLSCEIKNVHFEVKEG